jgi:CheY-like chemotaxis protein
MNEPAEKIRVLIVDDSPFSRHFIARMLDPYMFEVVGYADGFRSAIESYRNHMPDVVTMDIAMQEMDGLEVTQRIVAEEPDAKIVVLSSIMDDDLVKQAKFQGAVGILQKPFDLAEFMDILKNACQTGMVDSVFNTCYPSEFIGCFTNFMRRFTAEIIVTTISDDSRLYSRGISVLTGITGSFSGRMVFDLSTEAANLLAMRLLKQVPKDEDQVNDVIAELANIVAGNAVSKLNKEFRGAFLRITPPAVFTGEKFSIVSPALQIHFWEIDSPFGRIRLSVGFKKEGVS